MRARKTKAKRSRKASATVDRSGAMMKPNADGSPRLDPSGRYDLSTTEGTRAAMAEQNAQHLAALDYYQQEFEEHAEHMQEIDRLVLSIMVDLSGHDMSETIVELAKLAKEAFHVRLFLEAERDPERRAGLVKELGRAANGGAS
ncbi:MAG TPA: hypothetical protein VHE30_26010 [Polyangiaceae bacterium]|nr:hypothetical protein [Polyangiaceae bacterium]